MQTPLLQVKDLKTYFHIEEGTVLAVDGVSFDIYAGENLALVGESGSGKSVTAMSILGLVDPPGKIIDGSILYNDQDLTKLNDRRLENIRGKEISMIFQEPMTSLNPVYTIGRQIAESITAHESYPRDKIRQMTIEFLKLVEIPQAEQKLTQYPHEFSGGMRQRVMIAMAIALQPKILIADEPTTALDVTIQAQIMKLVSDLQKQMNMSVLLITHNLGIVAQTSDRVAVMYAGQIVEMARTQELFSNPMHPYTRGLLRSLPTLEKEQERLYSIRGNVPTINDYPAGCRFAPRCNDVLDPQCCHQQPQLVEISEGHHVRCLKMGERP